MNINRNTPKSEIRRQLEAETDLRFGCGIDFHATRLSDRGPLLEAAKKKGYRHVDDGMSLAYHFYQYLEKGANADNPEAD